MKKIILILMLCFPSICSANFIFGNTTTGTATTGGSTTQERARSTKFMCYKNAVVNSLSVYTTTIPNTYSAFSLAIYADGNSYTPTAILAKSNTTTFLGEGWNTLSIADTAVVSGSAYWLAVNANQPNFDYHYNSSSDINNLSYDFQSFPTALPDIWSNADNFLSVARIYSIYASGIEREMSNSWSFVCVGDLHFDTSTSQPTLFAAIQNYSPNRSFILSEGDNTDGGYTAYWNSATTTASAYLTNGFSQIGFPPKFISAPGNHDLDGSGSALTNWKNFLSYQNGLGNDGKYFSFDYQNARFIFLDAFGDTAGAQTNFLKTKALSNPKKWLFIVFHAPVFAYYGDFGTSLNTYWGPTIRAAKADFVITGHHHLYTRTKKIVFGGSLNPTLDLNYGTTQLTADNNNDSLHAVTENYGGNQYALAYSYDQYQTAFLGYTEISISGSNAILKLFKSDGTIMDSAIFSANPKPFSQRESGINYNPPLKTGGYKK